MSQMNSFCFRDEKQIKVEIGAGIICDEEMGTDWLSSSVNHGSCRREYLYKTGGTHNVRTVG